MSLIKQTSTEFAQAKTDCTNAVKSAKERHKLCKTAKTQSKQKKRA